MILMTMNLPSLLLVFFVDEILLERIKISFPLLAIKATVISGEALNDAAVEEAVYTGLDKVAEVIPSGLTWKVCLSGRYEIISL